VAVGARLDIARGLPVVHLNFSAYDEHAHRRGPSSSFAHRALGGIDRAMGRVWRAAQRSARRDYDVWIYSDHGQEDVLPYPAHRRLSLPEAVQSVLKNAAPQGFRPFDVRPGHHRSLFWPGTFLQRMFLDGKQRENEAIGPWLAIAAMGPLGHIYFSQPLSLETKETLARRLVREAKIPLVLTAAESGSAKAFTEKGEFLLPEQAAAVFGAGHPFLPDVAQDMTTLCRHPDAGALLISGWAVDRPPLSLSWESGAHGGPGPEETHGFALLPVDAPLPPRDRTFLRPTDLRHAALLFLGRSTHGPSSRLRSRASKGQVLRLMTYNVHSCIGMDGKLSPTRIARVIARENVDVAALQELDVHRPRTGGVDQAEAIAERLNMLYHFQPAMRMEEEKYGDAILSRYPMRLVRAGKLPDLGLRPFGEPRGALWVTVDFDGVPVQVVNTHLGLHEEERRKQLEALLGPDWLTHPAMKGPVIFCGDFNAWPGASVLRPLDRLLRDAALEKGRSLKTWFGRFPLGRLDHVFVGKGVEVLDVRVPGTELEKTASDHLPLIVEARISL
jgi:endonuclease/exonuclease/phosphatase family metal-dependent hydrolase